MCSTSTPAKATCTTIAIVSTKPTSPTASPAAKPAAAKPASTNSDEELRTPPESPTAKSYAAAVSSAAAE